MNGNYGTNIMGMVENGNGWDDEQEVADTYLNNMGAIYDEGENWGEFQKEFLKLHYKILKWWFSQGKTILGVD